jgi:hypothetical protein
MAQESTINPRERRQDIDAIEGWKGLVSALFDLLLWFRGEERIGVTVNTPITAGQNVTINIEPGQADEEWELLYIMARDASAIDAADVVEMAHVDQVSGIAVVLDSGTVTQTLTAITGGTVRIFPGADNASALRVRTAVGHYGWTVKLRDGKTPWLRFVLQYKASATVGTRNVTAVFTYRRRRLTG